MEDDMGLIELWGMRTDYHQRTIGGPFEPDTTRVLLATFTRLEDAKKYVRDSELAVHPNRYVYVDIQRGKYRYRKGSLLREFDDCELCEHHERPGWPTTRSWSSSDGQREVEEVQEPG